MTSLAYALHTQYDNDPTSLLCVGLCRRRKPRTDFRETPWHGRAPDCKRCEGLRYVDEIRIRQAWELEQERAKVRMLVRHVQRLRFQRMLERVPKSADVLREYERPYRDAYERHFERWSRALMLLAAPLPDTEPERRQKRTRLTLQMERIR
ncbi:hypothetical protein [Streptomyces sp. NPDC060001]|uniref:hypothetical protein n=1 Tax=Streptomyces sp. NPDC060001 TaxID=3347032 RepID=UPI0036B06FB7